MRGLRLARGDASESPQNPENPAFCSETRLSHLAEPACDTDGFAGNPFGLRGNEKRNHRRDVPGLPDAAKRRLCDHLFLKIGSRNSHGTEAFRFNPAWINRVDSDFSWPKLLRQYPGDCIYRSFGSGIDYRVGRGRRTRHRADIDHAPAIAVKMLHRFLAGEYQTENIGIELALKLNLRHFFKRFEVVDAGVVDQDIDLAERLLRFGKYTFDIFLLRDIALDCNRFPIALADCINYLVCILLRRRIVD